jgi:hypothetical protein
MEINPKRFSRSEFKKKARADEYDRIARHLTRLLFSTSLLTPGFYLGEPTQFAGRIHRMDEFGCSSGGDDEGPGEDNDIPPLEEAEGCVDETPKEF